MLGSSSKKLENEKKSLRKLVLIKKKVYLKYYLRCVTSEGYALHTSLKIAQINLRKLKDA